MNGSDARQIADRLKISEETVKTHRKRAFIKLGLKTKSQLFQTILRRIMHKRNID
ncbi:helix-turn-helix transcriptional regulator [Ochrobactrum grignonense]|nr:helix-turn-helix transcriptional regulator [Brucella grignonensis]